MEIFRKENVNGLKMNLIPGDWPITDSIMETGKWEPRTTQFIKDNLKPGQIFVDVGANVGYYTLLASKIVGNSGKVYAFEPLELSWTVLSKNLGMNELKNVIVFFMALSNNSGLKTKFYTGNIPGHASTIGTEELTVEVEVNNDIFDRINLKEQIAPDMIKIDVEGSQLEVLKGMKDILSTEKELTVIVEDFSGVAVEWLVDTYGFEVVNTEREVGNYMLVKNRKAIKIEREPITFHLLGTFNTPTNLKEGVGYAFCSKIINISKALRLSGHKVIFYGAEGSDVPCDEFVKVLRRDELPKECLEKNPHYVEDINHIANKLFNVRCIDEIKKRKGKYFNSRDILLVPTGLYQKEVVDKVGLSLVTEIGIGYNGIFTDHKIFESSTWQHWQYGKMNQDKGKFYDAVIPPIFDKKDFDYREKKEDYFLFIGRIVENKGVMIAIETCKAIGAKLKIAGIDQGMKIAEPNIEMVGFADLKKRKELLSKAKAVFVPTIYIEPFGYVVMEALMSGTPVITTDFGAFTETVIHGKVGYRCRTLSQFITAAKNIDKIKPSDCREWAENFTLEKIAPLYNEYFLQMQNLFGRGWYSKKD